MSAEAATQAVRLRKSRRRALTVAAASTKAGTTVTVAAPGVLGNDLGTDLRAEIVDAPAHGTATIAAGGTISYTPVDGFSGTDQLTYREMLQGVALEMTGRKLPIVVLPLLTPGLSSRWLALVTDVDVVTGRNLIDSMSTEVLVRDTSIRDVVPGEPLTYDESVRRALAERAEASAEEKR